MTGDRAVRVDAPPDLQAAAARLECTQIAGFGLVEGEPLRLADGRAVVPAVAWGPLPADDGGRAGGEVRREARGTARGEGRGAVRGAARGAVRVAVAYVVVATPEGVRRVVVTDMAAPSPLDAGQPGDLLPSASRDALAALACGPMAEGRGGVRLHTRRLVLEPRGEACEIAELEDVAVDL